MAPRTALPRINALGASRAKIDEAIALVASAGTDRSATAGMPGSEADRFIESVVARHTPMCLLSRMPAVERRALEIAVNERLERRSIEGELALLELEGRKGAALALGVTALDATLRSNDEPNGRTPHE